MSSSRHTSDSAVPERPPTRPHGMVLPSIDAILRIADDAARPYSHPSILPLSSMEPMSRAAPVMPHPCPSANRPRTSRHGPGCQTRHISPPAPHPPRRAKKYPCSGCNSVFERPSSLKQHMLSHTGEKPHVCPICTRRFSVASNLRRHVRSCQAARRRLIEAAHAMQNSRIFSSHEQQHSLEQLPTPTESTSSSSRSPPESQSYRRLESESPRSDTCSDILSPIRHLGRSPTWIPRSLSVFGNAPHLSSSPPFQLPVPFISTSSRTRAPLVSRHISSAAENTALFASNPWPEGFPRSRSRAGGSSVSSSSSSPSREWESRPYADTCGQKGRNEDCERSRHGRTDGPRH